MRVVHLALSPCLVFGLLFFPAWGLAGAGVATCIAQVVGAAINFRALFTGSSRLHLTFRGYRPDFPLMGHIARLGAPAAVTSAERNIAQIMLIGIVAPFGDYVLAAYSLTRRTEMFAHMAMGGMGQSAGILAAQNLGAGKPNRARLAVKWAMLYACLLLAGMGALLYVFAEPVVAIFNEQPEMLGTAAEWLRIQVLGYSFLGISTVLMQAFQSAGDTTAPMLVSLIAIWGVQQPLAVFLPGLGGLGEYGIAWAINIALLARCIFFVPYFRWGPWMKKRVVGTPQARHA